MLQHLLQFINDSLITHHFLILRLYLLLRNVDQRICHLGLRLLGCKGRNLIVRTSAASSVELGSFPRHEIAHNGLLIELIELNVLINALFLLLLINQSLVYLNLFSDSAVLLLLEHQLLHKHSSLLLLRPILRPQLLVLLKQRPILVVNPLRDVRNQLEVMLQLGFAFFLIGPLVALVGLALLYLLLHLG